MPSQNPNLRSWKPGQSGNPKGRRAERRGLDELFYRVLQGKLPRRRAEAIIERWLNKCEAGDMEALKFLWEQICGKAPQRLRLEGDSGPVMVIVKWDDDGVELSAAAGGGGAEPVLIEATPAAADDDLHDPVQAPP